MSFETIWPDGAQAGVVITVNVDGESVERRERPDEPLWGRYSYGRYGLQIGTQRILELFDRDDVRATFFMPAWDVEHYPDVARAIVDAGHEISGHGYLHEDFSSLAAEEQATILGRSEDVFESVIGSRPGGWRAPSGLMTSETRALLIERGYRYDSSFCDDDVPYIASAADGRKLVEIPTFATASDSEYYRLRRSPKVVERAWQGELAAMYQVGGLMTLTIHPRGDFGSGRAVRLRSVGSFLQTLKSYSGIWTPTCAELADWALESGNTRLETFTA